MTAAAIEGAHRATHDLHHGLAHVADELTGRRMPWTFDHECSPIYAELVAELGVPGQDIGPGPVIEAETPKPAPPKRGPKRGAVQS